MRNLSARPDQFDDAPDSKPNPADGEEKAQAKCPHYPYKELQEILLPEGKDSLVGCAGNFDSHFARVLNVNVTDAVPLRAAAVNGK